MQHQLRCSMWLIQWKLVWLDLRLLTKKCGITIVIKLSSLHNTSILSKLLVYIGLRKLLIFLDQMSITLFTSIIMIRWMTIFMDILHIHIECAKHSMKYCQFHKTLLLVWILSCHHIPPLGPTLLWKIIPSKPSRHMFHQQRQLLVGAPLKATIYNPRYCGCSLVRFFTFSNFYWLDLYNDTHVAKEI